ncbi:hypothetical protein E4U42_005969 [Claviceps africana]|uniref:Uncharacterized protein n=1 Tax=Claviceps africana TaxID=83212 RepID=A0A8K0J915_9HYPO|nr:hypothetical protein E4U42_005969 [Claviceps africana]
MPIVQTNQPAICDAPCVASLNIPRRARATPEYALERGSGDEDEEEEEQDDGDGDGDGDGDNAAHDMVKPMRSPSATLTPASSTSSADLHAAMSVRNKSKRQVAASLSALNSKPLPNGTPLERGRPWTSTVPVQIPKPSRRDAPHPTTKANLHHPSRRQHKHAVHSPDAISPSVAALLALTDIPRPPRTRRPAHRHASVSVVDDAMSDQDVSEKAFNLSLNRGPLDLLLSPPEDLLDDDLSPPESHVGSLLARTISADSVSSLGGESCATEFCSSVETPQSITLIPRRRSSLVRKSLEPVRSPPDATEEHPLAIVDVHVGAEDLGFEQLERPDAQGPGANFSSYPLLQPFKPLRSVFKSNLTASLRALKSAAKSFSSINFSYIPADDLLTRSILTIDPNVPYTDECRPPVSEEMPSAELRRYLNPMTSNRFDAQATARPAGTYSASIQLQTYKIQRSISLSSPENRTLRNPSYYAPPPPPSHRPVSSSRNPGNNGTQQQNQAKACHRVSVASGMRQREMRENPDFIRIAVMEMAMRRRGKLDDQKPGRARWVLPPRRPSAKPYEVGSTGIPTRWIPATY